MTRRSITPETGSMTLFFAAVIFPLVAFALALSLDLVKFRGEMKTTQEALDEAAMRASKLLPFKAQAGAAAAQYLTSIYPRQFPQASSAKITTTGDSIEVVYNGTSTMAFGPLLSVLTNAAPNNLLYGSVSKVRVTPFDVLLLFDASSYMAPPLSGPAWGDQAQWPDSSFFRNEYDLSTPGGPVDSRVATQLCFSPSLWNEKKAIIHTYQYFSNFDNDQVGIGVFPGSGEPVSTIRNVASRSDTTAAGAGAPAEARYVGYNAIKRGDTLCSAAAEREYAGPLYRAPNSTTGLSEWTPSSGSAPTNMILAPDWDFNPAYQPYVTAKSAIWSAAARDTTTDFPRLLEYASTQLLGAQTRAARGNLKASSVRYGFVFSGNRPFVNGEVWNAARSDLSDALTSSVKFISTLVNDQLKVADYRLKLFYIVFDHAGTKSSPIASDVATLQTLLSQAAQSPTGDKFELSVVYLPTSEALLGDLVPLLMVGQRNSVVNF